MEGTIRMLDGTVNRRSVEFNIRNCAWKVKDDSFLNKNKYGASAHSDKEAYGKSRRKKRSVKFS